MPVTLPQDALATQADLDALTERVTALEGGSVQPPHRCHHQRIQAPPATSSPTQASRP